MEVKDWVALFAGVAGALAGMGALLSGQQNRAQRVTLGASGLLVVFALILAFGTFFKSEDTPTVGSKPSPVDSPVAPMSPSRGPAPLDPATQSSDGEGDAKDAAPVIPREGKIVLTNGYSAVLDTDAPNWSVGRGCGDCDLWFQGELMPGYGGDLAPLVNNEPASYLTCASATQYTNSIEREMLKKGLQVCVKTTQGNFALAQVMKVSKDNSNDILSIELRVLAWSGY